MVNLKTFDLNLLRVFEAVYRERSVSNAADGLGLSQPAVSNALKRLRGQVADKLFVRTRRGLEPTPVGQRLYQSITVGMDAIRAGLLQSSDFEPKETERVFNLIMTDVGAEKFLPGVLRAIEATAPNIRLNVQEADADRIAPLLETGAADLAIGRLQLGDGLISQMMDVSSPVVLVRDSHPIISETANGSAVMSEEYFRGRHILVNPRGASSNPLLRVFQKNGVNARQVVLTMTSFASVPHIIRETDLIATVPEGIIRELTAGGGLTYFPLPFELERNYVYQWWHQRNNMDPGLIWLRNLFDSQRTKIRPDDLDLKG